MAYASFRLRRVWSIETAAINTEMSKNPLETSPETEPARAAQAIQTLADSSTVLSLYLRYESRYRRQLDRAHRQLLLLQRRRPPQTGAEPAPLSPPDTLNLQNELPATPIPPQSIPESTFKPTLTHMAAP